jgi:hypothetical protein
MGVKPITVRSFPGKDKTEQQAPWFHLLASAHELFSQRLHLQLLCNGHVEV